MGITEQTLKKYEVYLQDGEWSRATVEKHTRGIKWFLGFPSGNGRVKKEKAWEYREILREQYKITSANPALTAMNSFSVSLDREELKVRLFKIQRSTYSKPGKKITEKEYVKLIRAAEADGDEWMSMLLQAVGSTGIWINELKLITVGAVNAGRVEIYNKGKLRVVSLPTELTRLLRTYCRKMGMASGSTFTARNETPMDRSNISKRIKQLGRKAEVDVTKVFPHGLHHLSARVFYSIKKDVVWLMDLLGHSSISTTRAYTMSMEEQPGRQMLWMKLVLE